MLMQCYFRIFSMIGLPQSQWAELIFFGGNERRLSLFLVLFADLVVGTLEKTCVAVCLVGQLCKRLYKYQHELFRGDQSKQLSLPILRELVLGVHFHKWLCFPILYWVKTSCKKRQYHKHTEWSPQHLFQQKHWHLEGSNRISTGRF